jgi:hypothetical protein
MRAMETTGIAVQYEPCAEYTADGETPVCSTCGWLDIEHGEPEQPAAQLAA